MAMQQLPRHQISSESNFEQSNGYFVSVGYKDPLGKKYNSLYACLFRKCCILVRVDATHQSSTTTSSTPSDPNFSAHKAGHSGSNIGSNIDAT